MKLLIAICILCSSVVIAAELPPRILLELNDKVADQARIDESYLPASVLGLQLPDAELIPVFFEPRIEALRASWYAFGMHRFFRLKWDGEEATAAQIGSSLQNSARLDHAEILSVSISDPHDALDLPNDHTVFDMWGLNIMNCPQAWDIVHGNHTIKVTTIDTGCDIAHPDLAANIYVNPGEDLNHNNVWDDSDNNGVDDDGNGFIDDLSGWDFVSHSPSGTPAVGEDYGPRDNEVYPDVNGHGTHVMGTAAGVTNNSIGVSSASWNVAALPLRSGFAWLDDANNLRGSGYTDDFAPAIQYAVEMGVRVISISFGGSQADQAYEQAINFARANNVLVLAAAGNNNTSTRVYPGAYDASTAVAATDWLDRKAGFSSYGTWVDIAAPGVNIWSTLSSNIYHQESYAAWGGTSMATPNAAAVAALVLSAYPALTDDQLREILIESTDNIDANNPNYAGYIGSGRVNALTALQRAAGNDLPRPEFAGNYMDHLTGVATLAWTFDPGQHSDFLRFRIYRDGVLIDSTVSNFRALTLPAYGFYRLGVSAFYQSGESSPANATIFWSQRNGIPYAEYFESDLSHWEYWGPNSIVTDQVFAGNGALRMNSDPSQFSGLIREFDGVAGLDVETWFRLNDCPQPGGASVILNLDGSNGLAAGVSLHRQNNCAPAYYSNPGFLQGTPFDESVAVTPDQWYKLRMKVIGPYLQYMLLDQQHNALISDLVTLPILDNIYRLQIWSYSAVAECYLDNIRLRPYTGAELTWFGFTETFSELYTLVIDNATLDGIPLAVGDEIAVFDGDLCVGAEKVDGEYPLEINAWRATATDPGYIDGHAILYSVWSAEHGEYLATAQQLAGGSVFGDGIFSRVSLAAQSQAAVEPPVTGKFELHDAYPNPFNPSTRIEFEIPKAAQVTLKLYNMLGQEAATLLDQPLARGTHSVMFHGETLASGLYVARLEAGNRVAQTKLLLLK